MKVRWFSTWVAIFALWVGGLADIHAEIFPPATPARSDLPPSIAPATLPPLQNAAAVAAGWNHTCAATAAGGVKCWGLNDYGQLGDGTLSRRWLPTDVVGLTGGATAVAAGESHSCAMTAGGGIQCWGQNHYGQLGDGTTTQRLTPRSVSGLVGAAGIAAGQRHTCALTAAGGVKCWGVNWDGQLGDGTNDQRNAPVDVVGLTSGVTAIALGAEHSCALTAAGAVKCWGRNASGQLGDGAFAGRSEPADVLGLTSGVRAIAAGQRHTCAVTSGGGVRCWGANEVGQLGDGNPVARRSTSVQVSGLTSGAAGVTGGGEHSCALLTAGGVKCWGRNRYGQLGDGTTTERDRPVNVTTLASGVSAVAAGGDHTCARTATGHVKCWGWNGYGQLGDGTITERARPANVNGLATGATMTSAGRYHTCAIASGGAAKCWGWNGHGQLGDGTTSQRSAPVGVLGLPTGVRAVIAGSEHACAITSAGGVKCWGWNGYGQLGDGTTTDRAASVNVSGLTSGVTALAAGHAHTCALTSAGAVKCWGRNDVGQLGDATTTGRATPVNVAGLTGGVTALSAGSSHTCALMADGAVKCWGWNGLSQLGDGTTTTRNTPVDALGLPDGAIAIAAGEGHTCAVTPAGGVKCWGWNTNGQLGDGTKISRQSPTDVVGLAGGVAAISAGKTHTCALTTAGGVKCWGANAFGQVGDGSLTDRATPADVVGLGSGEAGLTAGMAHTCARSTAGGIACWGWDGYGQLGLGSAIYRAAPVNAVTLTRVYLQQILTN